MKKRKLLAVLSGLALLSLVSSCGETVQGEKGEKGDQGETGLNGSDGKDGSAILTGEGAPKSADGKEGDLYLDTSTGDLYLKGSFSWEIKGNIKGEQGEPGKNGTSITETKINEDGELIVVYSDGTTQNLGVIKSTAKHTVNFYFEKERLASLEVGHGEKATAPTGLSVEGYSIKGWNSKEDGGYRWLFSAYPVLGDLDLYADYEANTYMVTFVDNTFGLEQKTMEVTYNASYDFSSVYSKLGYACTFKDADGNSFDTIGTYALTDDLTLYASWTNDGLILESEDISKGTVDITAIKETSAGTCYTIKATPKEGYVFEGWYKGDEWLFQWEEHDYVASSKDVTLTARFITEEEQATRYAATPVIDEASKTVTFGYYPQTLVSDESLIAKLEGLSENGYLWVCYKGDYYKKAIGDPAVERVVGSETQESEPGYAFENGTTIEKGKTYWFKCEKIAWRILTSTEGSYSLVSEKVLDASTYDDDENYYAKSNIQSWLNGTFALEAFQFGALDKVEESMVDNSLASTGDTANPYVSEKTEDRVYLPSVQELKDTILYPDATYRVALATDYARALKVFCGDEPTTYNAYYWTRSPNPTYSVAVHSIDDEGGFNDLGRLDICTYGVRPEITIKVS